MKKIPAGALLTVPPDIMVSFFSRKDIEKLVSAEGMTLNGLEKIEILETATIHAYQPDFQRHHDESAAHLKRLKISEQAREDMMLVRFMPRGCLMVATVVLRVRKPGVDELARKDLDIVAGLH